MSQGDYNIQNQGFPAFRSDLNSTLSAINTSNSGTSRPSSAVAGTVWLDVTNATNPTLKFFDGTDDISLAQLDYTANTVNWLDSTVTISPLTTDLDVGGNAIVSSSNGNITFTPDGTGKVIIDGLSHPTADGTSGQFMKTDGSGNLSFDTVDLTNLSATNLTSGTVPIARLGTSGTKDATTFLRGDNTFAAAGGGKVLQVITAEDGTTRSTTSTSFATGSNTLSVDITPSATSSKIFVICHTPVQNSGTSENAMFSIFRDSTNLGDSSSGLALIAPNVYQNITMTFLDSPNSTSELTYQVYMKGTNGNTASVSANGPHAVITAMEIGS